MLLERKELHDEETSELYYEAYFDSSNLIKSIYIPNRQVLFIFFKKGVVYSYHHVTPEIYNGLENADSQGTYFSKNIAKNRQCEYFREYKLYEFEKEDLMKIVNEHKERLNEGKNENNS